MHDRGLRRNLVLHNCSSIRWRGPSGVRTMIRCHSLPALIDAEARGRVWSQDGAGGDELAPKSSKSLQSVPKPARSCGGFACGICYNDLLPLPSWWLMRRNRVYFEGFRLDSAGLSRVDPFGRSEPVVLGARAFDLLSLLVDRRGEVVPKEAIMQAVWPGLAIEDGNLTVQISTLRRVLDRDRAAGSCIQTIAGRGYRFLLPVSEVENSDAQKAAKIALPSKPSIAVLPFENLSGDPEQDYFADCMVEEIITALSRI